jgi:hypothetical protein
MNEAYEELSRRATKGDENAIHELFDLAEHYGNGKDFKNSAVAFRDAAIAYRISTFRIRNRAEDAEGHAQEMSAERDIYKRWIEANPRGLRELPYRLPNITYDRLRDIVLDELMDEESFVWVFWQSRPRNFGQ